MLTAYLIGLAAALVLAGFVVVVLDEEPGWLLCLAVIWPVTTRLLVGFGLGLVFEELRDYYRPRSWRSKR